MATGPSSVKSSDIPQGRLIDSLLEMNHRESELFCRPDMVVARELFENQTLTTFLAFKCSDARKNLRLATGTPVGFILPHRDIGGRFDFGSSTLQAQLEEEVSDALRRGRRVLSMFSYHFSAGDPNRGCAGFNNDNKAAFTYTATLCKKFEVIYGQGDVVVPVHVGFETDKESLILHGANGQSLDVSQTLEWSSDALRTRLRALYPNMHPRMISDFMLLIEGNQRHIREIVKMNRQPEALKHREWSLAIGRGFWWIPESNIALIIGPYSYKLPASIATAANILLKNIKEGRISAADGVVLMTSGVYRAEGPAKGFAKEKALSLSRIAMETIKEQVPELMPYVHPLPGIVDLRTLSFKPVPIED